MIPLFLERVDAEERRFIRSAPQNAILSHAAQGSQTQGFQNHIPARGRKHVGIGCNIAQPLQISKPHPRKGTETTPRHPLLRIHGRKFQNHIPARGRKQLHDIPFFESTDVNFKTTSPQGDGNTLVSTGALQFERTISKPHPRKGTAHTRGGCTKLKLRATVPLFFCNFLDSL